MPLIDERELLLEVPGWTNPRSRTGLDSASLEALGKSILTEGLLQDLLVWKTPGDHYVVIDGQRRLLAIRLLQKAWKHEMEYNNLTKPETAVVPPGAETSFKNKPCPFAGGIPYKLIEAETFLEATYKALATYQRKDLSSFELVERLVNIKTDFPKEHNRKLAKQVQKSEAWVSKMLKAWTYASDALKTTWRADKLTDEQVQLVAAMPEAKQAKAIEEALALRLGGKGKVTRKLRDKEEPPREESRSAGDLKELLAVVESWDAGLYKDGARDAILWALKRPIAFRSQVGVTIEDVENKLGPRAI